MARPPCSSFAVMPRKPAEPSFAHMSAGNALEVSVSWATSAVISRRVKSWTDSRRVSRSERVGGTKLVGCLDFVEVCRTVGTRRDCDTGRRRWWVRLRLARGENAEERVAGGMVLCCIVLWCILPSFWELGLDIIAGMVGLGSLHRMFELSCENL